MNEPRSARYHRVRRRTIGISMLLVAALLGCLLATNGSAALRGAAGGSAGLYALVLMLAIETAVLPLAAFQVLVVDREYGLADVAATRWWRLSLTRIGASAVIAALAAELLFGMIRAWPIAWWLPAAGGGVLLAALATSLSPLLILPLVDPPRPLRQGPLHDRLTDLARRLGMDGVAIEECGATAPEGCALASLVGAGGTRRVLVSSRLLADFTEDEVEVIVAHELGHHAHRDLLRALAAELGVLLVGFFAAAATLDLAWTRLGLLSPADPAALPLIVLIVGGGRVAALPLLNALSRRAERRADRFALGVASRPDAFAGALRRMAARNLAEERPSRVVFWLFHTHPTVEQRLAEAEAVGAGQAARLHGAA